MQNAVVIHGPMVIQLELPPAQDQVLPGIDWGAIEAFPTPAYWSYQVIARRVIGNSVKYKLGRTFAEEVGACLLGGHGIPAHIGLKAFEHLKTQHIFESVTSEECIFSVLSKPLHIDGKTFKYRFARQKSKYLAGALQYLSVEKPPLSTGRELRDWLLAINGIGPKTASWIARNWLDADDVAILDIHILRAGQLCGFFSENLTIEKNYCELEDEFLRFSKALGVRPSELDAVIWLEMMSSPKTVRKLLEMRSKDRTLNTYQDSTAPAYESTTHPYQASLID